MMCLIPARDHHGHRYHSAGSCGAVLLDGCWMWINSGHIGDLEREALPDAFGKKAWRLGQISRELRIGKRTV